jgi:hypothetical protein
VVYIYIVTAVAAAAVVAIKVLAVVLTEVFTKITSRTEFI